MWTVLLVPTPTAAARAQAPARAKPYATDAGKRSSGWAVDRGGIDKAQTAVFEFETPITHPSGTKLTLELDFFTNTKHTIGRPRFAITGQPKPISLEGSTLAGALAKLQKAVGEVEDFDNLTEAAPECSRFSTKCPHRCGAGHCNLD